MQISDNAAIVTGGASGLGGATARALAARGARVFALDLPKAVANAEAVDGVTYVEADVTSPEQVQAAVDTVVAAGAPLRITVNCAGVGTAGRIVGKNGPHDLDTYRKVIEVNLIGTFNVLRLAAEAIAAAEPIDEHGQRGLIVNTASIAAFDGQIGQVAYAASKGGVVGMTLPIARDLARNGIRNMTIAPGIFGTPMLFTMPKEVQDALAAGVPFPSRLGTPADYAKLVHQIITNEMLNGEVIRLDGAIRLAPK
jgi:NAD(P)-dependent dehydrogenase (short-subunit alcohol dehydrogenase family)